MEKQYGQLKQINRENYVQDTKSKVQVMMKTALVNHFVKKDPNWAN